jgi:hypothetical protein
MVDEGVPEKSLNGYIEGRRPVGRSGGRCLDAMDRDVKRMLKCRNWRRSAEDKDVWRRRIEEAWRRRIEESWRRRIESDKVEKILDVPKFCST